MLHLYAGGRGEFVRGGISSGGGYSGSSSEELVRGGVVGQVSSELGDIFLQIAGGWRTGEPGTETGRWTLCGKVQIYSSGGPASVRQPREMQACGSGGCASVRRRRVRKHAAAAGARRVARY